ncbi:Predicted metal-dependent peptidase [Clostridium acidisoli DSM 12555]|uniref:Predicted metal-dependent peptidase n=1 Tax=Clostridium acidisoli DSM 12555 TaxID=1121291 RepID=A0A1W1X3H2_9CLOT|nr:VWA-like domain-containing protein [Clostridium acidisoli]SMC18417.1 Predicted metal-dependent peptidase [Clostridium acidisoli DSM 12555]
MESKFDNEVKNLCEEANKIVDTFFKTNYKNDNVPEEFKSRFFILIDKVNLSLMEDEDNFYGYFLFQMEREIRFNISSPTAVNFKGAKYVIYFNPIIFLNLNIKQMESTIKHEILHILSMHLIRAKKFKENYNSFAVNMAMDIVVNTFLDNLPPYATTLDWVNVKYNLKLFPFKTFEYYVEEIQTAIDIDEEYREEDNDKDDKVETEYNPQNTHDIWEESSDIDEKTLKEFTEKFINNAKKGTIPEYLDSMVASLKSSNGELPWNLYLKKLMGTIESNKKKTITRRSRRQPDRLDLRGELRDHMAEIAVAIDISGSISDEEFNQAIKEVIGIVKNYKHEITIIECDNEIRRIYKIKFLKDIRERIAPRGGTKFNPVFEYVNKHKFNLLIYFTDGKGEEELLVTPNGYKTLWVISGRGDKLSLKEPYGIIKKLRSVEIKDDGADELIKSGFSMMNQEPERI